MDFWLSLIKELIWALFWAIALLAAREPLRRLAKAVEDRIVAGTEFEAAQVEIRCDPARSCRTSPQSLLVPRQPPVDAIGITLSMTGGRR